MRVYRCSAGARAAAPHRPLVVRAGCHVVDQPPRHPVFSSHPRVRPGLSVGAASLPGWARGRKHPRITPQTDQSLGDQAHHAVPVVTSAASWSSIKSLLQHCPGCRDARRPLSHHFRRCPGRQPRPATPRPDHHRTLFIAVVTGIALILAALRSFLPWPWVRLPKGSTRRANTTPLDEPNRHIRSSRCLSPLSRLPAQACASGSP